MNRIFDVATYAVLVAAIVALTRPGSQGPGLITAIGNSFSKVLQAASGTQPSPYAQAPTGYRPAAV
jgi:hypothetical protein